MTACDCKCEAKRGTHAIFGRIERNGRTDRMLYFIDAAMTLEEAKAEAVRIWQAWSRGARCWTVYAETAEACRERLAGRPRTLALSQLRSA